MQAFETVTHKHLKTLLVPIQKIYAWETGSPTARPKLLREPDSQPEQSLSEQPLSRELSGSQMCLWAFEKNCGAEGIRRGRVVAL